MLKNIAPAALLVVATFFAPATAEARIETDDERVARENAVLSAAVAKEQAIVDPDRATRNGAFFAAMMVVMLIVSKTKRTTRSYPALKSDRFHYLTIAVGLLAVGWLVAGAGGMPVVFGAMLGWCLPMIIGISLYWFPWPDGDPVQPGG